MGLPEIYLAAREGDAERVAELLRLGHDPNVTCNPAPDYGSFLAGVTPLMAAAASPRSNASTVAALLAGGADPFAISDGKVTALWYAAGGGTGCSDYSEFEADHLYRDWGGGDVERLHLLLAAGLSAREFATNGRSAVYEACSVGDLARVSLLVDRGGKVTPTGTGWPIVPLFAAVESGNLEIVTFIESQGFGLDFVRDGKCALCLAPTVEIAEYLMDRGLPPAYLQRSSVLEALESDRVPVGLAILHRVTDPEQKQHIARALLVACSTGYMKPEAIRALLDLGANDSAPHRALSTALHAACWLGDHGGGRELADTEATLRLLLEAGADPNFDPDGNTPLHEAAWGDWGSPTAVKLLLEFGAEVDALDKHDETPLMRAAGHGELECVKLLLAAGADPIRALPAAATNLEIWTSIVGNGPADQVAKYEIKTLQEAQEVFRLIEDAAKKQS